MSLRSRTSALAAPLSLCALLLAGCPEKGAQTVEPARADTAAPQHATESGATSPPATATEPPAADTSASGPPALPRTPRPDDGKDQLALCETRPIRVGAVPLTVYLADTPERRELGLMHVRSLPDDRGMLFIYPDAKRHSFWMRNTFVPLSLAYIRDDGTIDQLVDMEPHDERPHPSVGSVRFVLEVRQGWFREHQVAVGDRLEGIRNIPGY